MHQKPNNRKFPERVQKNQHFLVCDVIVFHNFMFAFNRWTLYELFSTLLKNIQMLIYCLCSLSQNPLVRSFHKLSIVLLYLDIQNQCYPKMQIPILPSYFLSKWSNLQGKLRVTNHQVWSSDQKTSSPRIKRRTFSETFDVQIRSSH